MASVSSLQDLLIPCILLAEVLGGSMACAMPFFDDSVLGDIMLVGTSLNMFKRFENRHQ